MPLKRCQESGRKHGRYKVDLRPCFMLLQFAKASRYFVAAVKAFHADQPLTTQKDLYGLSRAI
ncbi:MAG: hypothetical protein RLY32_220 [Pseudomonadota bacterium]|jgi:hypothetical protein